jgi:hypothetical protein
MAPIMKRNPLLIVVGIFILALIGYWAYSYFQGHPDSTSNFNFIPWKKTASEEEASLTVEPLTPGGSIAEQIRKDLSQKYQIPESEINIEVEEFSPSHARGRVNYPDETESYWWLAFKEKGGWRLIVDGKGSINCSEIVSYAFPQNIVPECYR